MDPPSNSHAEMTYEKSGVSSTTTVRVLTSTVIGKNISKAALY